MSRRSRFLAVAIVAGLAVAGLLMRLVYLQVVAQETYLGRKRLQSGHQVEIPASRGRILDRAGRVLAHDAWRTSIWADHRLLELEPLPARVQELLGAFREGLFSRLADTQRDFVWVKRYLPLDAEREYAGIDGLHFRRELHRHYPAGPATAHVVGLIGTDRKALEAIEYYFDEHLAGMNGTELVLRDARGARIRSAATSPPRPGKDIHLTIDRELERVLYGRLASACRTGRSDRASGAIVVVDSATGEVLALTSYPSFDPNEVPPWPTPNIGTQRVFPCGRLCSLIEVAYRLDTSGHAARSDLELLRSRLASEDPLLPKPSAPSLKRLHRFGIREPTGLELYERFAVDEEWFEVGWPVTVNLVQVARAFAVFANGGTLVPVHVVADPDARDSLGRSATFPRHPQPVLFRGVAEVLHSALVEADGVSPQLLVPRGTVYSTLVWGGYPWGASDDSWGVGVGSLRSSQPERSLTIAAFVRVDGSDPAEDTSPFTERVERLWLESAYEAAKFNDGELRSSGSPAPRSPTGEPNL